MILKSTIRPSLLKEWPKGIPERRAYVDPILAMIARKYDFMKKAMSLAQEQSWKAEATGLVLNM